MDGGIIRARIKEIALGVGDNYEIVSVVWLDVTVMSLDLVILRLYNINNI